MARPERQLECVPVRLKQLAFSQVAAELEMRRRRDKLGDEVGKSKQ